MPLTNNGVSMNPDLPTDMLSKHTPALQEPGWRSVKEQVVMALSNLFWRFCNHMNSIVTSLMLIEIKGGTATGLVVMTLHSTSVALNPSSPQAL